MAILYVGTGETYATFASALLAAAATDDICIRSNLIENCSLNKNVNSIYSDNGSILDSTGNSQTLIITSGLTQSCLIRNLTVTKTSGAAATSIWSSVGSGVVTFRDCILMGGRTSGSAHNIFMSTANMFVRFERCLFIANFYVLSAINVGNALTSAYGVVILNCIFIGDLSRTGINSPLSTATTRIGCYNSTFYKWNRAYETYSKTDCYSNLFIGNNQDLIIGGGASKANYLNCAFQQQVDDGGWDATTVFGVTATSEVVDAVNSNFNLKPDALCRNKGRTIAAITNDYAGLQRPRDYGVYDIGAYEYQRKRPHIN